MMIYVVILSYPPRLMELGNFRTVMRIVFDCAEVPRVLTVDYIYNFSKSNNLSVRNIITVCSKQFVPFI